MIKATRQPRRRAAVFIAAALTAAVLVMLALRPAAADSPRAAELSAADKADIGRVEDYLNGIATLNARFLQISTNGGYAKGAIYLWRPGRMRIEYDPPTPILIVADGSSLFYQDKDLGQISEVPIGATPASVLLDERIALLSGRFTIVGFERQARVLRLTMVKTEDAGEGRITLIFGDRPLVLKKWTITDAQGITTTVSLLKSRFGVPLKAELFQFEIPEEEDMGPDS
ncbi:MAG TPA: outer membrane lipoprotein carrier protein LolA [Rhodospirillales bacterium]|jgi:outer membrane lipoprotein-sorting protein|nr:outer membrane lipoprotein carrier protein LolA [Rhodospirillales bacterium]